MRVPCLAAIFLLSAAAPLGYAQTQAQTQAPTPHQGTGNQRGAGLSPENSSNGGAGTTSTKHSSRHKSKKTAPAQNGSTTAPGTNTNPGETPANGKASNGSTPPQL